MTNVQIAKEVRMIAFEANGAVSIDAFVSAMSKISPAHGAAAQTVVDHYGIRVGLDKDRKVVFPWE
jgi:hypothetical protein